MLGTILGLFFGIANIVFWAVIVILLVLIIQRRIELKKKEKFEKRNN
jgi:uncharacterized membrane protein